MEELQSVFRKLGVSPSALLRKNDKAFKENDLTGQESDAELLALMSQFPTLLQRPIGVLADSARVGRPPENLLELVEG